MIRTGYLGLWELFRRPISTGIIFPCAAYYEHRARDPEQARQIVQQALNELRRANQVGDIAPGAYREIKARFDRRMERLERKTRRPLLDVLPLPAQA